MKLIHSMSFLAALCCADAAQAQPSVLYSAPASGCVPDSATVRDDRARVGNASVQHNPSNVDPIVLTCTIPPFDSPNTNWALSMTYLDSSGTGTGASVRARLYRMQRGNASQNLLATVNSNTSADTTLNTLESSFFTHTFNFNTHIYWVHVELSRSATSQSVILHSVVLNVPTPSDIRLKHNVALLGRLDNGLGLYRFSYHGSDAAYVGVMAQEVQAIMPEAVVRGSDGYLRVFYDLLGLRMQPWDEWVAAGGKIPTTAASMQQ
jgi:hypothetical protein